MPSGILPNELHSELRFEDLKTAIQDFSAAERYIPVDWILEYNKYLSERDIKNYGSFSNHKNYSHRYIRNANTKSKSR